MSAETQLEAACRLARGLRAGGLMVEEPFQQGGNRLFRDITADEARLLVLLTRLVQVGYRISLVPHAERPLLTMIRGDEA